MNKYLQKSVPDKMGNPPTTIDQQLKFNKNVWTKFAGQAVVFALLSHESKREVLAIIEKVRLPLVETDKNLNGCYKRFYELKKRSVRGGASIPSIRKCCW
jgi:hypothetical protein